MREVNTQVLVRRQNKGQQLLLVAANFLLWPWRWAQARLLGWGEEAAASAMTHAVEGEVESEGTNSSKDAPQPAPQTTLTSKTSSASGASKDSSAATPVIQGRKAKKRMQQLARRKQQQQQQQQQQEDEETSSTTTESSNLEEEQKFDLTFAPPEPIRIPSSIEAEDKKKKKNKAGGSGGKAKEEEASKKAAASKEKPKMSTKVEKRPDQKQSGKAPCSSSSSSNNNASEGKGGKEALSRKTSSGEKQNNKSKSSPEAAPSASRTSPMMTISTFDKPPRLLQKDKQKARVTPVGKILPEPKKQENHGAQFGPVGARPPGASPATVPVVSAWSNSPAEATPPAAPGFMFGPISAAQAAAPVGAGSVQQADVHPEKIQDFVQAVAAPTPPPPHQGSPLHRQAQQQQQPSSPFHQAAAAVAVPAEYLQQPSNHGSPVRSAGGNSGATLMQSLQLERRQRTEEYLRQRQTDWPGFDQQPLVPGYLEDLWDSNPAASRVDPMRQQLQQQQQQQQQQRPTWGDVWPSATFGTSLNLSGEETMRMARHQQQQGHATQPHQQPDDAIAPVGGGALGLNPLQLSNIWNSPRKTLTRTESAGNDGNTAAHSSAPWAPGERN